MITIYKSNILERLNKRINLEIGKIKTEPETINTVVNIPITIPLDEINHLERFQQQAKAAYKKFFMGKRTPENEKSYYVSWYNDMKSILNEYDITQQQFFNFIK